MGVVHTEEIDARRLLRDAGLRVTAPRIAVVDAVAAQPHSDAEAIAAVARTTLGTVSTQAVYDVLNASGRGGKQRPVRTPGGPAPV
ncbi:transcriptional repressor, partial [Nocardia sp. NPDC058497]